MLHQELHKKTFNGRIRSLWSERVRGVGFFVREEVVGGSPPLLNIDLTNVTPDVLQDLHTFLPIGWRPLSSLSFAEDIYLRLGNNSELLDLTDKAGHQREFLLMEISTGKSRAMVNTFGSGNVEICLNGIHLEEV